MTKAPNLLLLFFGLGLLISIAACDRYKDDDDSNNITTFDNGFFIVNEGIDNGIDGSISYYDRDEGIVVNDIFNTKNGMPLSGTVNSLTNFVGRAYIVQDQTGNIVYCEEESMAQIGSIEGFQLPRYMLPLGTSKIYVSQWGENGGQGSIQIFDPTTNAITGEILTAGGAEQMLQQGDFVYLSHTGGFFVDSVVTKINITTDAISKVIPVGISPQSMQLDANAALWVLANGLESFTEVEEGTLAKIVNDEVVFSMSVPSGSRDLVINNNRNTLYFINGLNQKIYAHNINSNTLALAPFSDVPVTGLSFDPMTDLLIGLDAKNFQIPGVLLFFDEAGDVTEEFGVGIVPGRIAF